MISPGKEVEIRVPAAVIGNGRRFSENRRLTQFGIGNPGWNT
jgi:hypothetical protein